MKKITVLNRRNQELSAIFHKPANQTNKIIIFTHSFKSDKDTDYSAVDFARYICNEGYSFIRFDCWGSGESDGKFEDSSITTQIEDLQDIIKYVKSQGYSEICLMGLSLGTTDSIMAYDESIRCMILWSPIFNHSSSYERFKDEILEKGFVIEKNGITGQEFKIGKKMWQDFKDINPALKLPKIKCPVLAIIGTEDHRISEEKAQGVMKLILSDNKLEIIQGGDHDFLIEEAKKKAIQLSTDFIKAHL